MAITHATVKAPGQKLFAGADWNAAHSADSALVPNLNADLLDGSHASSFVPYTGATSDVDLGSKNLTTIGTGTFNKVRVGGELAGYEAYEFHVVGSNGGIILRRTGSNEPFIFLSTSTLGSGGYIRALNSVGSPNRGGLYFADSNLSKMLQLTRNKAVFGYGDVGADYQIVIDGESNDATITFDEDNNILNFGDTSLATTGTITGGAYKVGATAGIDASFSILDGDGVTSHNFVFTKGLLTSYSTS